MGRNGRSRQLVILVLLGALLEPLGHQLAYLLRYGPSRAIRVETVGAHAYFPRLASATTVSLALIATAALLVAVLVRLVLRRPTPSSRDFPRVFLILATVQCALFGVQETAEAAAIQASPDVLTIALLAFCAQLPLAALAALLVNRLQSILALAPEAARLILALPIRRPAQPGSMRPVPVVVIGNRSRGLEHHPRRGPPLPV